MRRIIGLDKFKVLVSITETAKVFRLIIFNWMSFDFTFNFYPQFQNMVTSIALGPFQLSLDFSFWHVNIYRCSPEDNED